MAVNKALLRRLARKLRRIRHEEHYNQQELVMKTACGTAACIAVKNTNNPAITSNQKCLCGTSTVGSFTHGFHHGAHLCALTITTNHPRAGR